MEEKMDADHNYAQLRTLQPLFRADTANNRLKYRIGLLNENTHDSLQL